MNDYQITQLQARIAKLEAQLYAIGAGGVGQSIHPQVQPDTAAQQEPVAHLPCCGYTDTLALQWNPYNGVAQCHNCGQVYATPQPTENLKCKSIQKRLATLWGYVKQDLAHQPLTEAKVHDLLVAVCSDGSVPSLQEVKEQAPHIFELARAIEAAHNITGDQQ